MSKYPASITNDQLKRLCPVFADNVCPFSKLPEEKKGAAGKCPVFKSGCPFKGCTTVGQFEDKLGEMRDKCKGDAAYVEFLREVLETAKEKEAVVGKACPFFKAKGGCPFAKDTSGKPIICPDYIVTPMDVTFNDIMSKCPAFDKAVCPYAPLVEKHKGIAKTCPAFKEGCPFKKWKSVGEFVEKMTQMRDTCKGKSAQIKFFEYVRDDSQTTEKKKGVCPFMAHVCVFSVDANGKPIIPK